MTLEGSAKLLSALHAEIDSIPLDPGDRRLRDSGGGGQIVLAHSLQLTDDPYRFANKDINLAFCSAIIVSSDAHHLDPNLVALDPVYDAILLIRF